MSSRTLTDALKEAIRADGRSQREIAEAAGTHQANIARFLSGERTITLESADALVKALKVRPCFTPAAGK